MGRTALVTGANRGIGLQVCRQLAELGLTVVLGARNTQRGTDSARILREHGVGVRVEQLDVADSTSVDACGRRLEAAGIEVDILVNNAGIYPIQSFFQISDELMKEAIETNMLGAFRTAQEFIPGMVSRQYGRVVNVSSGYGSINDGVPGPPAYSISKAGLNALTRSLAAAVASANVKVNAICPGWVATEMGGPGAPVTAEEAAETIVWAATLPDSGPTNGFFRNRQPIAW